MALYLFSAQYITRGNGRCAVAAAAYRSGERLQYDGQIYDFTKRRDVVYKEISLPDHAPPGFDDRQMLWCEVERAEDYSTRRKTARTAREIVLVLPRELMIESQVKLVKEFVVDTFVRDGMCADVAIHSDCSKAEHNPHAHVMLTTRSVGPDGFGLKCREWDHKATLVQWREGWANAQNKMFARKGLGIKVTHRSYKDQGRDRKPTFHLGPVLSAIENREIPTRLGYINRAIDERNREREALNKQLQSEQDHDYDSGQSR